MAFEWILAWLIGAGLAATAWLVWMLVQIFWHVLRAAVAGLSFTRFAWACGREHGFTNKRFHQWVYAPSVWLSFFLVSLGAPKGSLSHMGGSGKWEGIGNWTVFPRKDGGQ